jgi:hypothetical protein
MLNQPKAILQAALDEAMDGPERPFESLLHRFIDAARRLYAEAQAEPPAPVVCPHCKQEIEPKNNG